MIIKYEEGRLLVERPSENKLHRSLHGLTRTLLNNMVVGVTSGFQKNLELVGSVTGPQAGQKTGACRRILPPGGNRARGRPGD